MSVLVVVSKFHHLKKLCVPSTPVLGSSHFLIKTLKILKCCSVKPQDKSNSSLLSSVCHTGRIPADFLVNLPLRSYSARCPGLGIFTTQRFSALFT